MVYALMFAFLVFVVDFIEEHFSGKVKLMKNRYTLVRWATYVALVVMVLLFGVLDGGSFIYFQF